MPDYTIRIMNRRELDWAVDMAAEEGWNPGLYDAEAFYEQDPQGFLIGILDGKPIGCISAVSYEGIFGFIGFYIVIPEYRGQGFGIQLWNSAMNSLDRHTIGLDGVFEQQANYSKSGFEFQYSNIRFEYINRIDHSIENTSETIEPIDHTSIDNIAAYETKLFPANRKKFLKQWLKIPGASAVAALRNNALCGYGVIRPCRSGYKIGPLLANTPQTAEHLFTKLCAFVKKDTPVYLDVPEINLHAMSLARKYNMQKVIGTARMYKGAAPELDTDRIYGVTSFELG